MPIESSQNDRVRLAKSLHTAKGRREAGLFLAEGPSVVTEALGSDAPVAWVAWCEELSSPRVAEVLEAALEAGIEVVDCGERAFRALSDTQSPQGIAAVLELPRPCLAHLKTEAARLTYLVLHDVRDPGNLGTMVRTADAFGADAVILAGSCADPYEPKVVRATAGSLFHLPVIGAAWREFVGWAAGHEVAAVASSLEAESGLGATPLPHRLALVVGNEAHGLAAEVLQDLALRVRIPMSGRAESLNAAAAAAVLLYEASRREPPTCSG